MHAEVGRDLLDGHSGFATTRDAHDIVTELARIRLGHNEILPGRPPGQPNSDVTYRCGRPISTLERSRANHSARLSDVGRLRPSVAVVALDEAGLSPPGMDAEAKLLLAPVRGSFPQPCAHASTTKLLNQGQAPDGREFREDRSGYANHERT